MVYISMVATVSRGVKLCCLITGVRVCVCVCVRVNESFRIGVAAESRIQTSDRHPVDYKTIRHNYR